MSLHGGHVAGVNPTLSIGGPEMSRNPLAGGGMKHESSTQWRNRCRPGAARWGPVEPGPPRPDLSEIGR
jgi:hypothetical protein